MADRCRKSVRIKRETGGSGGGEGGMLCGEEKGMAEDKATDEGEVLEGSLVVRCDNCSVRVRGMYIQCSVCVGVGVCARCFSRGVEFGEHRSDHDYCVGHGEESVVEAGWGAGEEVGLLEALGACGMGDWEEISRRLPGRSPEQCQSHYTRCYLNPSHPALASALPHPTTPPTGLQEPVEYEGGTEDPPRPQPGSAAARDLAGYNPARGDFETEVDSEAEAIICDLDPGLFQNDPPGGIGAALQATLLDQYRRRMAGRHECKRVVKQHGLIAVGRSAAVLTRHRPHLPKNLQEVLPRLLPLMTAFDLDLLLESIRYESELKRQITELVEWRTAGLTRHRSVLTYETLRRRREVARKERRNLVVATGTSQDQWNVLPRIITQPNNAPSNRRVSAPLNIYGKPGYSTLNEPEKLLCSELRLLPQDFLRFKTFFTEECRRSGGLRLAQARALIKIDVNKTRKIYDHLLQQGLIYTSNTS